MSKKDITVIINGGVLRMDEAFYVGLGETYESLQDVQNLGAFLGTVGMFLAVGEEGLEEVRRELESGLGPESWEFPRDNGDDEGELQ
jgi:hypothetical protein